MSNTDGVKWEVHVTSFNDDGEELPEEYWGDVDESHVREMLEIAKLDDTPRWIRPSLGNEDETVYVLHSDGNGCLERYTPKAVQ